MEPKLISSPCQFKWKPVTYMSLAYMKCHKWNVTYLIWPDNQGRTVFIRPSSHVEINNSRYYMVYSLWPILASLARCGYKTRVSSIYCIRRSKCKWIRLKKARVIRILISLTSKVFYDWIRDLEFNFHLHQKLISVLVRW